MVGTILNSSVSQHPILLFRFFPFPRELYISATGTTIGMILFQSTQNDRGSRRLYRFRGEKSSGELKENSSNGWKMINWLIIRAIDCKEKERIFEFWERKRI